MDSSMFDGLEKLLTLMLWTIVLAVPLAVWKLGELAYWIVTHIEWRG